MRLQKDNGHTEDQKGIRVGVKSWSSRYSKASKLEKLCRHNWKQAVSIYHLCAAFWQHRNKVLCQQFRWFGFSCIIATQDLGDPRHAVFGGGYGFLTDSIPVLRISKLRVSYVSHWTPSCFSNSSHLTAQGFSEIVTLCLDYSYPGISHTGSQFRSQLKCHLWERSFLTSG